MANEYLKRTPTSTGNRKVWTLALWLKRNITDGGTGADAIFNAANTAADSHGTDIRFRKDNNANTGWNFYDYNANAFTWVKYGAIERRDSGNWFHAMFVFDSTKPRGDDRVEVYINGILDTNIRSSPYDTNPPINYQTYVNSITAHYLGVDQFAGSLTTSYSKSQFADVFLVDGQALTPDVFGFYKDGNGYISAGSTQATDFRPGQWVPKTPRVIKAQIERNGGFGVNGFYLPMNDSSNFGADFHTTPNSIIKLQEDLPQPKVSITSTAQAGLGYTDVLRADPYAANLVLAIPFVNSGLCTDGTNSGISTGFGDYSHIINTSQTAKDVQLITYNGTTPTIVSYASSSTNYYGSACYINGNGSTSTGGHIRVVDDTIFDNLNLTTANWTIEGWFNPATRASGGGGSGLFIFGDATDYNQIICFLDGAGDIWNLWSYNGSSWSVNDSSTTPQPPLNQWSHIAFEKVGTATTSYITTYVNGVAAKVIPVPQNINYASTPRLIIGGHYVSGGSGGDTFYYDGLVSDVRMYNVAKYKGGFDVPRPYTPVGIATWRTSLDTTANNFATWNFVDRLSSNGLTLSDGNLTITNGESYRAIRATVGIPTTGKWYYEHRESTARLSNVIGSVGIATNGHAWDLNSYYDSFSGFYWGTSGLQLVINGANAGTSWISSPGIGGGDILNIAYDTDSRNLWLGINGTYYTVSGVTLSGNGNPSSGTNPTGTVSTTYSNLGLFPLNNAYSTSSQTNFGQNPTFSGTTTAGTFTDSNGKGLFKYQPPSGFLALCEDNLPTPAIKNPGEHFKTVLYTGSNISNGVGRSPVTGVGFKPDLIWIKCRDAAQNHVLYDSVRGLQCLNSNNADAESTFESQILGGYDEDGFTTSPNNDSNYLGKQFTAWCWKAGGAAVSNTDGSITSQVSANQDAGFSIVSYTGNGSESATVGHGLGKTPSMVIVKARDGTNSWSVKHSSLATNFVLLLNSTIDQKNASTSFSGGAVENLAQNTFGFVSGTSNADNVVENGKNYIAYCWAEIENFSKFGSYVGNGNADGPFVYCGFKPAFVLIKTTSGGSWVIKDSSRSPNNPNGSQIYANTSAIDDDPYGITDFLSNGFKPRVISQSVNASGETYIFAAFAESPFQTANAK